MLFSAQIAPSRVTHAHNFDEDTGQRIHKQNCVGNYLRKPSINYLFVIIVPYQFRQALEKNLFDNDYECGDCGCYYGYCELRSESAFDKSSDEEVSGISCERYPV